MYVLTASLLLLAFVSEAKSIEVYVDPVNGSDADCIPLQNLTQQANASTQVPCRTINRALGNTGCSRSCGNEDPLYDSVVKLKDGVHQLQSCIGINMGSNITVEAENLGQATIKCVVFDNMDVEDNIQSCMTNGLVFRGINFEECGPLSPNVFLNYSTDVLFEDCSFRGNIGAPLRLQFVSKIRLTRTNFILNQNQIPAPLDSKNTIITELFDSITTAGGFTYYNRNDSVDITIEDCKFINNSANVNNVSTSRPELLKANGHGGGVLVRLAQVTNSNIRITNSWFEGNEAEVDGGGIYFSFSENFSSNSIHLYNNTFVRNRVYESTGGAVSWNAFNFSFNNSFVVEDCIFAENRGTAGGAVGISLYDISVDSFLLPDSAEFVGCKFLRNRARHEGSAVGLFSLVHVEEFGFPVGFTNCTFMGNSYISEESDDFDIGQPTEHASALVSFRFPLNLTGYNHFIGNVGGGITLLNTRLRVQGELLLLNNVATNGGGITTDDSCVIEVGPGVNMSFINNTATMSGGGLHVTFPAIRYTIALFNRLCFLQYNDFTAIDVPPHQWQNVSIAFIQNKAGLSGAAIYASDMQLCRWNGNEFPNRGDNATTIFGNLPQEIAEQSPFYYENNELLAGNGQFNVNLATAPHKIYATPVLQSQVVQPGEMVQLNILAQDQVLNSREAVWSLEAPGQAVTLDGISAGNETFTQRITPVIDGGQNCSEAMITGKFSLEFSLPGTLGSSSELDLNLSGCHPGYILDTDSCTCQCDSTNVAIVRCDERQRYIYLSNGLWGGTDESSGFRRLVTAYLPANFLSCKREGRLPGCRFQWDNGSAQCRKGRHGHLCGPCDENYAVTMDLQACDKSDNECILGLCLFILMCFLVVILSFLILYFNIGIPSQFKGMIFYMQVIGLIHRQYLLQLSSSEDARDRPLNVLVNLLGFSVPIPLCISMNLQAHHVALLGYISPILVLITVVTYAISARFLKVLSNRSSLDGIALLTLFIYKYVADTSFTLISCTRTNNGYVFTYDGSVQCNSTDFLFILILGIILLIAFVVPSPFVIGYICLKRPQRFQHYADALTHDLQVKRRWFGGWDIGRRLPFVFFSFLFVEPSSILAFMLLGTLVVLVVHLLSKPYESSHVNIIEALILANLVIVTAMSLNNPAGNQVPLWLNMALLLVPYIYGVFYSMWLLVHYIYKKKCAKLVTMDNQGGKTFLNDRTTIKVGRRTLTIRGVKSMTSKMPAGQSNPSASGTTTGNTNDPSDMALEEFSEFREPMLEDMTS